MVLAFFSHYFHPCPLPSGSQLLELADVYVFWDSFVMAGCNIFMAQGFEFLRITLQLKLILLSSLILQVCQKASQAF